MAGHALIEEVEHALRPSRKRKVGHRAQFLRGWVAPGIRLRERLQHGPLRVAFRSVLERVQRADEPSEGLGLSSRTQGIDVVYGLGHDGLACHISESLHGAEARECRVLRIDCRQYPLNQQPIGDHRGRRLVADLVSEERLVLANMRIDALDYRVDLCFRDRFGRDQRGQRCDLEDNLDAVSLSGLQ